MESPTVAGEASIAWAMARMLMGAAQYNRTSNRISCLDNRVKTRLGARSQQGGDGPAVNGLSRLEC